MADPIFDKEGNLTNLDELTVEEVATAYSTKNKELFGRMTEAETREKQVKADKAKLEEDHKVLEGKLKEVKPQDTTNFATKDELADFRLSGMGYDEETISAIKTYAKGAGKNPLDVLGEPIVKTLIESKEAQNRLHNAMPDTSDRTQVYNGKKFEELSTQEKIQATVELGKGSKIRGNKVINS